LCAGQLFHVNPHLWLIGQAVSGSYQTLAYSPGGLWIVFSDKISQAHQISLCTMSAQQFHNAGGVFSWFSPQESSQQIGCYTDLYYVDGIALEAFENFRDGKSDQFIPEAPSERPVLKGA